MASTAELGALIRRWKDDAGGSYRTWFLWEERLKNFRSIRRGLAVVVDEIERGTFGNAYRGSSLETVVGSIAEQRQIFKGADHAFLWKPKLRIPDIYESRDNQLAFGRFLHDCACCDTEQGVLAAIRALDARAIKGLGPAERKRRDQQQSADVTHTRVQAWLRDLGLSLGFDVWIAANDRSRPHEGRALADRCLDELPPAVARLAGADTIRLIDVIWLDRVAGEVRAAFEVEHTTSIYSGIVRLLDLALSDLAGAPKGLFIVAPDDREQEVRAQLARPAFRRVADLQVRYLPYGELDKHREAMGRFGQGLKPIEAVARSLA